MNGCTRGDKPLISIVMAVYHPKLDWLAEQLDSLNGQTYPNLELIVCDDGPDAPVDEDFFPRHITVFPCQLVRNKKNLGSNKSFERLTGMARGEYIAYCDQDDVWLPEKVERLFQYMVEKTADLVCSDVSLIDDAGHVFAKGIAAARPRHVFREGLELAPYLIYRNFVIGCTMLVRAERARAALPFAAHMVHDHYLAFYCAAHGAIGVCPGYLIRYRIHGGNQTGILARVFDRESYCNEHIMPFYQRVTELQERFQLPELDQAKRWALARRKNALKMSGAIPALWRLRSVNLSTTLFELIALRLPRPLFTLALKLIQAGKL